MKSAPVEKHAEGDTTKGRMLVISGPSGCGKSTICRDLIRDERVVFSISATTRSK